MRKMIFSYPKIFVGAIVFLVFAFIFCYVGLSNPNYSLKIVCTSFQDVQQLALLQNRLQQIQNWKPQTFGEKHIELLAKWLAMPEYQHIQGPLDCVFQIPPTLPQEEKDKLETMNSFLLFLSKNPNCKLQGRGADSEQARIAYIRAQFDEVMFQQRQEDWRSALENKSVPLLLQRAKLPSPPERLSWFVAWARSCFGQRNDFMEKYVLAFMASYKKDVEPVHHLYQSLAQHQATTLAQNNDCHLILRTMQYQDDANTPIKWRGHDSAIDLGLWLQWKQNPQQPYFWEADTGIRFLSVHALLQPDANHQQQLVFDWKTTSVCLDTPQFHHFLCQVGLPREFYCRQLKVASWEAKAPSFQLKMEGKIHHNDILDSMMPVTLDFTPSQIHHLISDIRSMATQAMSQLPQQLQKQNTFRHLALADVQYNQSNQQLTGKLGVGKFQFATALHIEQNAHIVPVLDINTHAHNSILASILLSCPELESVEGLIQIESIQVESDPPSLSGTLAILGSVVGHPQDLTGISWTMAGNGQAMIKTSAELKKYLIELAARKNPSFAQRTPAESTRREQQLEQWNAQIQNYLEKNYSKLGKHLGFSLSDTAYGLVLRLCLKITNWPEITLGPVAIGNEKNWQKNVSQLLSTESLKKYSQIQWKSPLQHTQYGEIQTKILDSNLQAGKVSILCSIPIPVYGKTVDLKWTEELSANPTTWTSSFSSNNTILRVAAQTMLNEASRIVEESTGFQVKLKINQDGFGPGHWLRMCPLGMYATITVGYSKLPFNVGFDKLLIDRQGIHWEEIALQATYKGKFPLFQLPGVPVSVSLRDPTLIIYWDQKKLAVEARIAPDLLLLDSLGYPLYLKARIEGDAQDIALRANGDLMLLGYRGADAKAELNWKQKLIAGDLHAQPIPDFPAQLNSAFRLNCEGLKAGLQAELLGAEVQGKMGIDFSPFQGNIQAQADLILFQAGIKGHTDIRFKDYEMLGTAQFMKWNVEVKANPQGWTWRFVDPATGQSFAVEGSDPKELSRQAKENIQKMEELQNVPVLPVAAQAAAQEVLPPAPKNKPQPPSPPPMNIELAEMLTKAKPQGQEKKEDEKPILPQGDLEIERCNHGQNLRFFTKDPAKEFLNVPASDLQITDEKKIACSLWHTHSGRVGLLIWDFRKDDDTIKIVDCANSKTVTYLKDITQEVGTLRNWREKIKIDHISDEDVEKIISVYYQTLKLYTRFKIFKPEPIHFFQNGWSGGFETEGEAFFFWHGNRQAHTAIIPKKRVKPHADIYAHLARFSPNSKLVILWQLLDGTSSQQTANPAADQANPTPTIAANQTSHPIGLLDDDLPNSEQKKDLRFCFDIAQEQPEYIHLVISDDDPNIKQALDYLMQLKHQHKKDLSKATCYLGSAGIFIYDDQSFYVLEDSPYLENFPVHTATWQAFYDWNKDTSRFLPKNLETSQARMGVKKDQLATHIVADFESSRKEGWAVSPLGLMIGLTENNGQSNK